MSALTCDVCQLPLMCVDDPEIEGLVLEVHQRSEHPDVLPWACDTCWYAPFDTRAVRCTDIHDGVSCPMWKRRPAWLK